MQYYMFTAPSTTTADIALCGPPDAILSVLAADGSVITCTNQSPTWLVSYSRADNFSAAFATAPCNDNSAGIFRQAARLRTPPLSPPPLELALAAAAAARARRAPHWCPPAHPSSRC